ncbi:hypothetical protein [Nonomuraea basaltis]|uniref:hypothetical protein n=1 Tax=Nonomuraea basaltis TaxID=2495887 RepID=UPI00110C6B63|nr:hypothetical protein [Nonomuraea basaltis]TMR93932.1 hypothetical protein EJK15_36490 [Nonomuraea basaltis]
MRLAQHLGIRDKNKISKDLRGDEYLPAWEYVEPNYLIPIEEIIGGLLSAEVIAEGRLLYAAAEKVATPHLPIPRVELEAQVIALTRKCHQLTEELLDTARREVELRNDLAAARAEITAGAQRSAQELAEIRARGQALEIEVERYRGLLAEMREQAITRDAELTRLNGDLQLAQTSAGYAVELEAELRRLRSSRALVDAVTEGESRVEASAAPADSTPIWVSDRSLRRVGPDDSRVFWNDGRALDVRALTPIPHLDRWWTITLTTLAEIASASVLVLIVAAVLAVIVFGPPFWLWGWQGGVLTALALLLLAISAPASRENLFVLVVAVGDAVYTLIAFVLGAPIRLTVYLITTLRTTRPVKQPRLMRMLASLVGDDFHAWSGVLLSGSAAGYLVACRSGVYVLVPQQAWQPDVTALAAAVARVSPIRVGDDLIPVVAVAVSDFAVAQDLLAVNGVHVIRTSQVRHLITRRPQNISPQILDLIVTSQATTSF